MAGIVGALYSITADGIVRRGSVAGIVWDTVRGIIGDTIVGIGETGPTLSGDGNVTCVAETSPVQGEGVAYLPC